MAKLGEGDARWIVDDRKDGTNVNQWHWQETDCLEWSKQKLKACFVGKELVVLDQGKSVVLESVDVTGEAYINTRKGKLIAGYELKVQIPFKTKSNSSEDGSQVEGKVEFPYIGKRERVVFFQCSPHVSLLLCVSPHFLTFFHFSFRR